MARRVGYSGAVALITGGASGLGKALAEALAERGAEVVVADRQIAEGEAVAEGIRSRGGKAYALALDVRDAEAFGAVAAEVVKRSRRIDLFFNNAGIGVAGDVERYQPRDWSDVLDVNLHGVTHGIDAVYPIMIAQGSGHIVNTASMAGLLPMPGGASYTASKHAVVGISKALRVEGAHHGVRVSVLCPGAIRTPILTGGRYGRIELGGIDEETILAQWKRLFPMEPAAFAEEVLDGVSKNEPYIIVPRWWRAVWLIERLSPRLSLYLAGLRHADTRKLARPGAHPPRAHASARGETESRPR